MRALTTLFALILTTFGLGLIAGCPPVSDDDDSAGSDDTELCGGPDCANSGDCPTVEPDPGDACDFTGNCHYCDVGSTTASGYTCDGTSFTFVNTFTCEEDD